MSDEQTPSMQPPGTRWGLIFAAVLLAVALIAGGLMYYSAGAPERSAKHACADAVRDELTSAGSAKFHYTLVYEKAGVWTVNGDVDSQDRFGRPARSGFKCTFTDGKADVNYLVATG
jgi:hypothetical protein